jgi:hypothetical protein
MHDAVVGDGLTLSGLLHVGVERVSIGLGLAEGDDGHQEVLVVIWSVRYSYFLANLN